MLSSPNGSPGVTLHSRASHGESGVNPAPVTATISPMDRLVDGTPVTVGAAVTGGAKVKGTEALLPSLSPTVSRQVSPSACWAGVGGQG